MTLALSSNLGQITEEINFYKQQAGLSLFEIGRRLKHVKENNLAHGQWESWCESELNISARQARKYIKVFDRFSNRNLGSEVGLKKLDMLAGFDDEELETPVELPSGETKAPLEMSNKELEQYKRRAEQAEKKVETILSVTQKLEGDLKHTKSLLDRELNRPLPQPQIITKPPADYEEAIQNSRELNGEVVKLQRAITDQKQTYEEKLSQQQKQDASKRDLQKYLSEQLRAIAMNHDSAIFNYSAIQGDRDAYDIVMRYLHQYETIIKKQFDEWKQLTSIRAVN